MSAPEPEDVPNVPNTAATRALLEALDQARYELDSTVDQEQRTIDLGKAAEQRVFTAAQTVDQIREALSVLGVPTPETQDADA